jgi:hypothetical protein
MSSKPRHCNSRNRARPKRLKDIPKKRPGKWAGDGYCARRTESTRTGRCHWHGETTPVGIDSPHTVHGLRSQAFMEAMPARLRARYAMFLADPERLSQDSEIATLNLIIALKLEEVDGNEYRPGKVYALLSKIEHHLVNGEVGEALLKVEEALKQADDKAQQDLVLREIERIVVTRSKLTVVQRDHMLAAGQLMSIGDLMGHAELLARAVRDAAELYVRPGTLEPDDMVDALLNYVADQLDPLIKNGKVA